MAEQYQMDVDDKVRALIEMTNAIFTGAIQGDTTGENFSRMKDSVYQLIFPFLKENYWEEAQQYAIERSVNDGILQKHYETVLGELRALMLEMEPMLNTTLDTYMSSSFGALLHLLGDSDLDFTASVKGLKNVQNIHLLEEALERHGFRYVDTRFQHDKDMVHRVFARIDVVDGLSIEIEVKIRDMETFDKFVQPGHTFIEKTLTAEEKILCTYAKFLVKSVVKRAKKTADPELVKWAEDTYHNLKHVIYYCGLAGLSEVRLWD